MATRERLEPARFEPGLGGTPHVGAELRAARERLGWNLDAVAAHLRIRQPYLEAIEAGRPDALPGRAYAIGFVRAYAKVMGLDPDEVSRRFRAEAGEVVTGRTELSFPAPVPERGVPALAVVAIGAILVIGAYVAWYRVSGNERPGPDTVQVVPEHLAPLVAEKPPAPTQAAPPSAPVTTSEPPALASPYASLPPVPNVSPSSAAAAVTPPAATIDQGHIVVRATSDAWIQVKDVKGQVLLNRVLHNGETWPVPPRPAGTTQTALLLTTGNAGGTELVVDGVPAAPLGVEGAVRRDLPLDVQAIRDGKLTASVPPTRFTPHNQ